MGNLGSGKFGFIKSAQHRKTGKIVAIKTMDKSKITDLERELIFREIDILKLCQHPNIIKLFDVFESKKLIHIVMECLKGGDLFDYLEKRKFQISEDRACFISFSIASAIFYIHNFGIIHRDIKPENILLINSDDNSDIKIVDFGLSKIIGPTERADEPYGTLGYVAPEVLMKLPYSKPVDVFSLGVVTYLLLVGTLPFDSHTEEQIAQ